MEIQHPTIKFYQKRSFGEKMSVAFDFIRDHFKVLFKLCAYLLLPVSLIQAIFMNSYLGGIMKMSLEQTDPMMYLGSMFWNLSGIAITSLIATAIVMAITFACIQTYNEQGTLKDITLSDLKSQLISNFKRIVIMSLVVAGIIIAAYIVLIISVVISPILAFITVPAFIAILFPLMLTNPIYVFEKISVSKAISRSFTLGFKTWGGLFGITVVMGILVNMLQGVASLPWATLFVVRTILGLSNPGNDFGSSFGISFFQYLTTVIMMFFAMATSILLYLALAYHYSSAAESADAISVNEDLENFEEL